MLEGNKKLVPISTYSWKSDKPMTKEDVNKRREEFWLTSPNYDVYIYFIYLFIII